MGSPREQNLEQVGLSAIGANVALVGDAAHDTVAFLDGPFTAEGTNALVYLDPSTGPVLGTEIEINKEGVYEVDAVVPVVSAVGAVSVRAALTFGAPGAQLATNPLPGASWVRDSQAVTLLAGAGAVVPIKLHATIVVTAAVALSAVGANVLRLQWSADADTAPVAVDPTLVTLTVKRSNLTDS